MKSAAEKDIVKRLRAGRDPDPPPNLLGRIREEIPSTLPVALVRPEDPKPGFWAPQRLRWAAASIFLLIMTGVVVTRIRIQDLPLDAELKGVSGEVGVGSMDSVEESIESDPRSRGLVQQEVDRADSPADALVLPSEAAPKRPEELEERVRRDAAETRDETATAAPVDPVFEARADPPVAVRPESGVEVGSPALRDEALRGADLKSMEPTLAPSGLELSGAAGVVAAPMAAETARGSFTRKATPSWNQAGAAPEARSGQPRPKREEATVGRHPWPPSSEPPATPNDQPYDDMYFRSYGVNPFIDTEDDRFSTFGLDVDTGSYSVARSYLQRGHMPPNDAIRVEEFVNYFDYGARPPSGGDFLVVSEGGPSPFAQGPRYSLLRLGVAARTVPMTERAPSVLTFAVDVSGSMEREDRLGLVKQSLRFLLDELRRDDVVGLVTFGSSARVMVEPTSDREAVRRAIDRLVPSGSTHAEEGLALAFEVARSFFDEGSYNRVILCSDGVANRGRTGHESILRRIESEARDGIELHTVGFGMGNYNDVLMEQLADHGDGQYAYVDGLDEARRVFVERLGPTLITVATEARAQVEFDPAIVSRYRLLGYENRDIADERFRDDSVDAGEIGAGHVVTALYEIKLHRGIHKKAKLATMTLRYRPAAGGEFLEVVHPVRVRDLAVKSERTSKELRLAAVVAEFAEILKGSYWARQGDLEELLRSAQEVSAQYPGNVEVAELAALIGKAARLRRASE